MVAVGDHRQLGAVGPGGAFEALQARWPGAVHVLDENVRQTDRAERAALAELRAGDINRAVDWYLRSGQGPDRPDPGPGVGSGGGGLGGGCRAGGAESSLFAWRRANVAELNQRAREAMIDAGRIDVTSQVEAPGGRWYGPGDRIVTLAPNREGQLVTSQRGRVRPPPPWTWTGWPGWRR